MNRQIKRIVVTGADGFIGSHFVAYVLAKTDYSVIRIDRLMKNSTYMELSNYTATTKIKDFGVIDAVVNFAASTCVDESIRQVEYYIHNNVNIVVNLLSNLNKMFSFNIKERPIFLQVSTDEVYGDGLRGCKEDSQICPRNPYSASKAACEHITMSYFHTFEYPTLITRGCNTFGPRQTFDKVIPRFIWEALCNNALPIYGDGKNTRHYMYVEDHCAGILKVLQKGKFGEVYNIGTEDEISTVNLAGMLLEMLDKPINENLCFVTDRLGHDKGYSMDCSKIKTELGWKPIHPFEDSLRKTVNWYLDYLQGYKREDING